MEIVIWELPLVTLCHVNNAARQSNLAADSRHEPMLSLPLFLVRRRHKRSHFPPAVECRERESIGCAIIDS